MPAFSRQNARVNIQLLSDLHLEVDPDFSAKPLPSADVLVLAGDIGSYQARSRLTGDDFGLRRFSPRHGWPTPVIYVPGNHEYDGLDFDETHARLQALCADLGIIWLERQQCVLAGVRFIGTTLWADFDALGQVQGNRLTHSLQMREKSMRAADYHLRRFHALRDGRPLLAEDVRQHGLMCQDWLRHALAQGFDGPTVVVTHFAPSLRSADPRYGLTPGTAAFCNSLDDLLPRAKLWLHGHLHCAHDYMLRGCRVVANPLGYEAKGERASYREMLIHLEASRSQPQ